jgi:hypothetical protein
LKSHCHIDRDLPRQGTKAHTVAPLMPAEAKVAISW